MVEITYDRQRHRLTAMGHAAAGRKGEDLVCAAVSALVLTVSANVAELAITEEVRRPVLQLRDGDSRISCVPAPEMIPVVTMIFDTVCSGFELLQTLYPENIRYHIVGQRLG